VKLYQAKAETCRQQAALPQNAAVKDRWLKLAEEWSALADIAKKDRPRVLKAKGKPVSLQVHIRAIQIDPSTGRSPTGAANA
jgi:hypothetical protein